MSTKKVTVGKVVKLTARGGLIVMIGKVIEVTDVNYTVEWSNGTRSVYPIDSKGVNS